ncbi:DUF262 domain-containing protein [Segeticoccus rhizosphaerae]|uniref:DUF262 domain-containing protein n=1 Tax=Segeticoccus rhizosphaerae TaxID=1104777 RepID=UPI0010C04E04|nr:DUF262 domain-containing protein [Ornithinicoccus soli]
MSDDGEVFEVHPLRNSNVQYLYSRRDEIDMSPSYQRQSAIWSLEKQQLLIDSLINGFDVPTIYLHQYAVPERVGERTIRYALVDGKQRMDAIFRFVGNSFALSEDFVRIADGSRAAAGKTFAELKEVDPLLASDLQATTLDVKTIKTTDMELVEDMFSRLNEAVPLNAAEKRNAFGGPMPRAVRELVVEPFFAAKLPFTNKRYRHYDLAAKFVYLADGSTSDGIGSAEYSGRTVRDLKKVRLDRFFKEARESDSDQSKTESLVRISKARLTELSDTFTDGDKLLSSVGMVTVYFLLALKRSASKRPFPSRSSLGEFELARKITPNAEEDSLTNADLVFMEFARLAQSPNDGSALSYRLEVLEAWLDAKEKGEDAHAAVGELFVEDLGL